MTTLNPRARGLYRFFAGLGFTLAAGTALADYTWNFPRPVTPIGRDTLSMHNQFMIIITVLFVVVFAIMIYSMLKHRKSVGAQPASFRSRVAALIAGLKRRSSRQLSANFDGSG